MVGGDVVDAPRVASTIPPDVYNQALHEFNVNCVECFAESDGLVRVRVTQDGYDEAKVISALIAALVLAHTRLHETRP
jgi:hypothetical protein